MFGIRYLKAPPSIFVLQFRNGKVVRQGAGLSFWYFAPTSEIVYVPVTSIDVPFVFNEVTSDFQEVIVQGQLTYRISDPMRVVSILDLSIDASGRYRTDDLSKLSDRLVHITQMLARAYTQRSNLRELLLSSDALIATVMSGLQESTAVSTLGVEVLAVLVVSIKANPEMTKALQAEAREEQLRKADEAIYARRNAAVQLERTIKENELNTEIAVEHKRRQVRETQMAADIAVEEQRTSLVDQRVSNERKEADARAHALAAVLEPLKGVDWRTLMAASSGQADPRQIIALAFRELAEGASKIGELNITPDLLRTLLDRQE